MNTESDRVLLSSDIKAKTNRSTKRKIILLSILLFLVLISGMTYAFFTATVANGDKGSSIRINTASLGLRYSEDPITCVLDGILPGTSCTHNFYVENTGNVATDYYVYITDVINTFTVKEDLIYKVTCQSVNSITKDISGTCSGKEEHVAPNVEEFIVNQKVDVGKTHKFTLTLTFKETGTNQNDNQGKEFSGKILVTKNERKVEIQLLSDTSLEVSLKEGMVPIAFDGTKVVTASPSNTDNSWFDYENQKWANAALVTNASRNTYIESPVGTKVNENDILAYFVYIPRYKYLLWNAENGISNEQEIKVEFENKNTPKSTGSKNGQWLTHPAFTFGNTEVEGIWVGKFELSADKTSACYKTPSNENCDKKTGITPRILPNADSWRFATVSTYFDVAKMFKNNSMYGISSTKIDSHMIKNIEWGAVSYLALSKYGKYGNTNYTGANKEVYINNYQDDSKKILTGCSGGTPNAEAVSSCDYAYPSIDLKATGASTSGTIYGIYDMSGGVEEYVMGNMVNKSGEFYVASAGTFTGGIPNSKYYDSYAYSFLGFSDYTRGKLGDATREIHKIVDGDTDGWFSDHMFFLDSEYAWFHRGGAAFDESMAGIFCFDTFGVGRGEGDITSRIVLLEE